MTVGMIMSSWSPWSAEIPRTGTAPPCGSALAMVAWMPATVPSRMAAGSASSLLASTTSARPSANTSCASPSSGFVSHPCFARVAASSASTIINTTCARCMLRSAAIPLSIAGFPSVSSLLLFIHPAVSTSHTFCPSYRNRVYVASRVSPGSGPVRHRVSPRRAFTRVDLPALGLPRMANCSGWSSSASAAPSALRLLRSVVTSSTIG
mmetsp:Transcript_2747/g.9298  ORF Transcript_2747/g.9298 Transcript_2747/m.9298 type:complete len:208 (-) Transcript_2747:670-1293(-)